MDTPYGTCECGCGETTDLYAKDRPELGYVGGTPKRFVSGHQFRKNVPGWVLKDCGYETPCHQWTGTFNLEGYGIGWYGSPAHRVAYEQEVGPIPEGYILHHKCENKGCVRVDHLAPVTRGDHKRIHAKIPVSEREVIRASTETKKVLAERYGVSPSRIKQIRRGRGSTNQAE